MDDEVEQQLNDRVSNRFRVYRDLPDTFGGPWYMVKCLKCAGDVVYIVADGSPMKTVDKALEEHTRECLGRSWRDLRTRE